MSQLRHRNHPSPLLVKNFKSLADRYVRESGAILLVHQLQEGRQVEGALTTSVYLGYHLNDISLADRYVRES